MTAQVSPFSIPTCPCGSEPKAREGYTIEVDGETLTVEADLVLWCECAPPTVFPGVTEYLGWLSGQGVG